jgi:hypothetical protein
MTLTLRWNIPQRRILSRWRGPQGMTDALARHPELPIAAIVGPPGPPGPGGAGSAPVRIDAPLAATWTLANPLSRIPTVQVFLASGEPVLTDVAVTNAVITVTFPTPQQGFILAF